MTILENNFNKNIKPIEYKKWLCLIRYLKELDLYIIFADKAKQFCEYTRISPKNKPSIETYMNYFPARTTLPWIKCGMKIGQNDAKINTIRFDAFYIMVKIENIK